MKKESRFLVQKKIWWGKSKKGASDQTQTMLALRANKGFIIFAYFWREIERQKGSGIQKATKLHTNYILSKSVLNQFQSVLSIFNLFENR